MKRGLTKRSWSEPSPWSRLSTDRSTEELRSTVEIKRQAGVVDRHTRVDVGDGGAVGVGAVGNIFRPALTRSQMMYLYRWRNGCVGIPVQDGDSRLPAAGDACWLVWLAVRLLVVDLVVANPVMP